MNVPKLKRKISLFVRKYTEVKTQTITPAQLQDIRFYQFKTATAEFFFNRLGKTDIKTADTPHYAFAKGLANGDAAGLAAGEAYYRDYIAASWATSDKARIDKRIAEFKAHFNDFRDGKKQPKPILSQLDGRTFFAVDGNHRTAFALALGRDIKVEIWPADMAFLRFSYIPAFYGTGVRNLPYQSLYLNKEIIVSGRRSDALERLQMIPAHVIADARILDVASNVGMSSILAKQIGAQSCYGLEYSKEMVDVANRLSMFNGTYPDVRFQTFNIDTDTDGFSETFDTAFMFSIHDHLKQPEKLIDIARKNVTKYVIFEAHPKGTKEKYKSFFESGLFKSVTELGALSGSVFVTERTRTLWLCEKH